MARVPIDKTCIICLESLESGEIVTVTRGIDSLKSVSLKRRDNLHKTIGDLESITVHVECRKKYVLVKNGKLFYQNYAPPPRVKLPQMSPTKKRLRFEHDFDFVSLCFLCGQEASIENQAKLEKKRRVRIIIVQTAGLKDSVLSMMNNLQDTSTRRARSRILTVDLQAVKARYHHNCFLQLSNRSKAQQDPKEASSSKSEIIAQKMEQVYEYIESSSDTQFTLGEFVELLGDEAPAEDTIKTYLKKRYGCDVVRFTPKKGASTIVSCCDTDYMILKQSWEERKLDVEDEKFKVLQTAATIIRNDITRQVCETDFYSSSDQFLENVNESIPQSLKIFVDSVILKKKKGSLDAFKIKCTSICHAIMQAVRPRSFLSPLQIGIAVMLHRKFASKKMIDILNHLGVCSSYAEACHYQDCATLDSQLQIKPGSFCQFVFDNADFNTNTLDGANTFHSMGGIQVVTPANSVEKREPVRRHKTRIRASQLSAIGKIPFHIFNYSDQRNYEQLVVENISTPDIDTDIICNADFMWIFGKFTLPEKIPGWNGFMGKLTEKLPFHLSRICPLQFVNSPPSDVSTIFTVLKYAATLAQSVNMQKVFVTFDLPLYLKAVQIIHSNHNDNSLNNIMPRLGGFHLLMSYLGAIGFIMAGSGLNEIFSLCYAKNSVEKMLAGHAYSRAIRAHTLVYLALCHEIVAELDLSEREKQKMNDYLVSFTENAPEYAVIDDSAAFTSANAKFKSKMDEIEKRGKTAQLWIQYVRMVGIAKSFVRSEKMGDLKLQLRLIEKMLPFFHASGHLHYAKAAHFYVQDMRKYIQEMEKLCSNFENEVAEDNIFEKIEEFKKFIDHGFCTVRRTAKFWSGNFTDQTIEQDLMRLIKINGGIIDRAFNALISHLFISRVPVTYDICKCIEEFCGVMFETSDQHVDARDSRIVRDNADLKKIVDFFDCHEPFPFEESIKSIVTGVIGGDTINCYKAREVGDASLQNIIDTPFHKLSLKRRDRVLPLSIVNSKLKIQDDVVPLDPMLLFQRICVTKQSEEELKEHFKWELSPYPLSLFLDGALRKTVKSALFDLFTPEQIELPTRNCSFVIDGGMLLHRVVWHHTDKYSEIIDKYMKYVKTHFGDNCTVVFDGYENNCNSTKGLERLRRSNKNTCSDVHFDVTMNVTVSQEKFLSNSNNKSRLIDYLKTALLQANVSVHQADDDADVMIVNAALSSLHSPTVIVSEDVDVLTLVVGLTPPGKKIYFLKLVKGKKPQTIYSSTSLDNYPFCRDNILFLHAFSGCDTTSCFYNHGKKRVFTSFETKLVRDSKFREAIEVFKSPQQSKERIFEKGMAALLFLYKAPQKITCINTYRYLCFTKSVKNKAVNLASLPPTADAAKQHFLRVYLQVQLWLSNNIETEEWGWYRDSVNTLSPKPMTQAPAPSNLLKMIFCNCTKGCGKACSCKKARLNCSTVCGSCEMTTCDNFASLIFNESDDENEYNSEDVADDDNEYDNEDVADNDSD